MKTVCRYIILTLLTTLFALVASATLYAQEDTTMVAQDDTTQVAQEVKVDKGWNAMNYSLQKRYKPQDEIFEAKKFTDHTFISLTGSGFGLIGNENISRASGVNFNVGVGKWFDKSNALRIELGGSRYFRRRLPNPGWVMELAALHQFNLSSYLKGYREGRFIEISTVEGISGVAAKRDSTWGFGAGVHLGLNFTFRLSERFDFFVEPIFSFYTAGIDPVVKEDWHKYDLSYRYTMGVKYNFFEAPKVKIHWLEKEVDGYMFYGGGVQSQNSDLVWKEVGLFNSVGPHAFIGVGSWVKDFFGVRGSLFYGNHIWTTYEGFGDMKAHYMGGRLEVSIEPFYWVHRRPIAQRRFTCGINIGPEIGFMNRIDVENNYSTMYIGATASIQPNVKITKDVGFFMEPRFSLIPYAVVESSTGGVKIRNMYFDGIFNINMGFTYSL